MPAGPARFDVTKVGPALEEIHERIAGVVIERLPFAQLIARYDRADFERLAEQLAGIKGRFLLSLNDTPRRAGSLWLL